METSRHTKGPWSFTDEMVSGPNGEIIADPYCMQTKDTEPGEMEANARLIAAAPEMREALEKVVRDYEDQYCDDTLTDIAFDAYHSAKSAIAKAKIKS